MKIIIKMSFILGSLFATSICAQVVHSVDNNSDSKRLVSAMLAETPIISDLQELTDKIGGRMTGTEANLKAVEWAVTKFEEAGISVVKEPFEMTRSWIEQKATAMVLGHNIRFSPKIVSMPFSNLKSTKSSAGGLTYLARGTENDFSKHKNLKGRWLLVETPILDDVAGIHGLFQEYVDSVGIEKRSLASGATGLIYMSSRVKNLMYRHLPSRGADNDLPIIVMERERALQVKRLLKTGNHLTFEPNLNVSDSGKYTAYNVVAEIKGNELPNEYVLVGAHIDSYDLGTGALDNGSNSVLVIDLARQIKLLNIQPKRTIRFVLFNGEEQGLFGSWGYTKKHLAELDKHIIAAILDIGTGKINGFFTNGRNDFSPQLDQFLNSVKELGSFTQVNVPVVGTDNFDFMMQGIPNIVANQDDANYASNYHAESDTFDKVDQLQLKRNSAIVASVILGFSNLTEVAWSRHTHQQVMQLVKEHDLESAMKTFGLYQSWKDNIRSVR